MFLLEAGRKANEAFNVPVASTKHTVADATEDTQTMMKAILERGALTETNRSGYSFSDPTTRGMEEKVAKGWIEEVLGRESLTCGENA